MGDHMPAVLAEVSFLLVAIAVLVSLARATFPAPSGRHRRTPEPPVLPWPAHHTPRRPERPLNGDATRLVRPYVVAAEQASRRGELLLADFGHDGPGLYVIHGLEVA
ncbi:hypothetical protein GTY65_32775 [Streptomyces sp. SID8379]|uniref:hypothetical protein n=1 Tax=unclassified Streptomyces TaxID=2593676 RepID=UPI0003A88F69|nr:MULTISPECIES: hypothetical protein [unclassified Streptomyces]MYW68815.1 hypothetical protein [Streptomyces sp. SID8379]